MTEPLWKTLLGGMLGLFASTRFYYAIRGWSGWTNQKTNTQQETLLIGALVLLWTIPSCLYLSSYLLVFARLSLPIEARWIGAGVCLASFALFLWSHSRLGKYWSPSIAIFPKQPLILNGPYRWVRHPMYAAMFGLSIGLGLASGNLILAGAWLLGCAALYYVRIPAEEAVLLAQYGEEYKIYCKNTGKLLPKIG